MVDYASMIADRAHPVSILTLELVYWRDETSESLTSISDIGCTWGIMARRARRKDTTVPSGRRSESVQEGTIDVGGSTEKFRKNWVAIVVFSRS